MGDADDLVSFIVVALNEEEHLERLLDDVARQRRRPLEVVVVDGGSRDRTLEIVRARIPRLAAGGIDVRLLEERDHGPLRSPGNARNIGIGASRGRFIVLLDADTFLPDPDFADVVAASLRDRPTVNVRVVHGDCTPLEQWMALAVPKWASIAYRRDVFDGHRFDPELGYGEDMHLWTSVGVSFGDACDATLGGHLPHTWREYYAQLRWYGRTLLPYLRAMRRDHPGRWKRTLRQDVVDRVPRAVFYALAPPLVLALAPFLPWASLGLAALFVAVLAKNWLQAPPGQRTPRGFVLLGTQYVVGSVGFVVGLAQGLLGRRRTSGRGV